MATGSSSPASQSEVYSIIFGDGLDDTIEWGVPETDPESEADGTVIFPAADGGLDDTIEWGDPETDPESEADGLDDTVILPEADGGLDDTIEWGDPETDPESEADGLDDTVIFPEADGGLDGPNNDLDETIPWGVENEDDGGPVDMDVEPDNPPQPQPVQYWPSVPLTRYAARQAARYAELREEFARTLRKHQGVARQSDSLRMQLTRALIQDDVDEIALLRWMLGPISRLFDARLGRLEELNISLGQLEEYFVTRSDPMYLGPLVENPFM